MARHQRDRSFAFANGSRLRHEDRAGTGELGRPPRHAATQSTIDVQTPPSVGIARPGDRPVLLSGRCSCARELTNVTIPGIAGDRWFRNVFTQCECGEVLMLTIGPRSGS
jgi:hypothetical protein